MILPRSKALMTRSCALFNEVFRELDARLAIFTNLCLEMLDQMSLQRQLDAISQMREERQLE
jgi:hypothetical protein